MTEPDSTKPRAAESLGAAPGRGRLDGRRILVVGGGQRVFDPATDPIGNGRAMCRLFAREGAAVAVADVNPDSARETVDAIEAEGGRAVAIGADIRIEADVIRMIGEAQEVLGGLDGMVANVGIFPRIGLDEVSAEEWDTVFEVNARGPMFCAREALKVFDDHASIVFISSVAALRTASRMPAYDASKLALVSLSKNIARLGAARGVRSNLVFPGQVDTPNGREAGAQNPRRGATQIPLGRRATGWEIAYATLFFLSDESAYVTGQTLAVDGGLSGI